MESRVATIGFGEAARAFAQGWQAAASLRAYDIGTDDPAQRGPIERACAALGVENCGSPAEALRDADVVLSLVTAGSALAAARADAPFLKARAFWCDMNSVAPDTKRAAAEAVEAAGGRYVDVAIMAPVQPARRAAPLLISGPHGAAAAEALAAVGFTNVRVVAGAVGTASAIKMIRSVMIKGMEALTAECLLAAEAAGVTDEVLSSLDASERAMPWAERADYNLDRMMAHGLRRAEEMDEVVGTLDALGTGSVMSRGAAERQRAVGALRLAPPRGLDAKLARLRPCAAGSRSAA